MHASFHCNHTSIRTPVQRWQFLIDYTAMHTQCVQLEQRRATPVCLPLPLVLGLHISSCLWGRLVGILQTWPTIEGVSALAVEKAGKVYQMLGKRCFTVEPSVLPIIHPDSLQNDSVQNLVPQGDSQDITKAMHVKRLQMSFWVTV